MSLARGIDGVHDKTGYEDQSAVVIAIAASSAERLRLAALVGDHAPVLLVGSREEALTLLLEGGVEPLAAAHVVPGELVEAGPVARSADQQQPALRVDSDLRTAHWRERSVPLSPLEHDVLVRLVEHTGRTLTFEHLHLEVWGTDHLGGGADLQSVVKRLRRKLHHLGSTLRIHAVRGVGVRLVDARPRSSSTG